MRFAFLCVALTALTLAGCAGGNPGTIGATALSTPGTNASKPKTLIVSNFVVAAEVPAIDRGFSTRQESKGGYYPILERRQRTLERVNDEIVAAIVVGLREAGLEAEAGAAPKGGSVRLSGRLRAPEEGKRVPVSQLGFGSGRGRVIADMTLSRGGFESGELLSFAVDLQSVRAPGNPKAAAARNEAIAAELATQNAEPEKLSPDVEGQARRLGNAIVDKVVAYAREQGWLAKPDAAGPAVSEAAPKKPEAKSKKPAA